MRPTDYMTNELFHTYRETWDDGYACWLLLKSLAKDVDELVDRIEALEKRSDKQSQYTGVA